MPAAHADLAPAAALAAADEHRPRGQERSRSVSAERERFADPQACAPQITISAPGERRRLRRLPRA